MQSIAKVPFVYLTNNDLIFYRMQHSVKCSKGHLWKFIMK